MFLRWDTVVVESPTVDTTGSSATLDIWIRRGDDNFSEDPDFNEDIEVAYIDSGATAVVLETFDGNGTQGEVSTRYLYASRLGPACELSGPNQLRPGERQRFRLLACGRRIRGRGRVTVRRHRHRSHRRLLQPRHLERDRALHSNPGRHASRPDGRVHATATRAGPPAGIGDDTFSVRWTGEIQAQYTEDYTFHALHDDGVRIWVDGTLVIDDYVGPGRLLDRFGYADLAAARPALRHRHRVLRERW
ncbi:MAG: PA14 domain-containing protein [Halofilum sp. (in: g-proteobacteria)]|nr:PA14 domain-containing protein [Halofilum sp. (in: g-proteobacteria)]